MAVTKRVKEKQDQYIWQEEDRRQARRASREELGEIQSKKFQRKPGRGLKGLNEGQLANGLGWLSLGLGLVKVIVPRKFSKFIGIHGDHNRLFRVLGAREIASGIGILTQRRPTTASWLRVGGDAIDLALLGTAFTLPKSNRGRLAAATTAVAGVSALDLISLQRQSRRSYATAAGGAVRIAQSVIINRSPDELYKFWQNFNNLPRFMEHLESVDVDQTVSQTRLSHWVLKAPAGITVEWDAEIIEDRPNEMIAWRSLEGSYVDHMGSVRFERLPGERGTLVRVRLQYTPPAGVIGVSMLKLLGEDPNWQVKKDLRRFKQIMEAGEILTTEGQPAGRNYHTTWLYEKASRI
jgi:uncharacterized membrane protein